MEHASCVESVKLMNYDNCVLVARRAVLQLGITQPVSLLFARRTPGVKVPTDVLIVVKDISVAFDKDPFRYRFLRNRMHTVMQYIQKIGASEIESEGYLNNDEEPRLPSSDRQGVRNHNLAHRIKYEGLRTHQNETAPGIEENHT